MSKRKCRKLRLFLRPDYWNPVPNLSKLEHRLWCGASAKEYYGDTFPKGGFELARIEGYRTSVSGMACLELLKTTLADLPPLCFETAFDAHEPYDLARLYA